MGDAMAPQPLRRRAKQGRDLDHDDAPSPGSVLRRLDRLGPRKDHNDSDDSDDDRGGSGKKGGNGSASKGSKQNNRDKNDDSKGGKKNANNRFSTDGADGNDDDDNIRVKDQATGHAGVTITQVHVITSTATSQVIPTDAVSQALPPSSLPSAAINPAITGIALAPDYGGPYASSEPRKGLPDSESKTTTSSISVLVATEGAGASASNPTGTALGDPMSTGSRIGQDENNKGTSNLKHKDKHHQGLSPTAERLLIAAGAMGFFILLCFTAWLVYRILKRRGRGGGGGRMGARMNEKLDRAMARVPWLGKRRQRWQTLGDDGLPPAPARVYSRDSTGAPTAARRPISSLYSDGIRDGEKNRAMAAMVEPLPAGRTLGRPFLSRTDTDVSAPTDPAATTLDSTRALGGGTAVAPSDPSSTIRSRMPDVFFNQSELARQPSDAYDPGRRQVNRASELSSLSSGFGDGDIIMPAGAGTAKTGQQAVTPSRQTRQSGFLARFSWATSRRETVLTQASEDFPPRFRTISSWVNQQTGRIRRAQQQKPDEDVPPVPGVPGVDFMPPDQQFTMMKDNEVPRRVDMNGFR